MTIQKALVVHGFAHKVRFAHKVSKSAHKVGLPGFVGQVASVAEVGCLSQKSVFTN